jgi:hypothetical protein
MVQLPGPEQHLHHPQKQVMPTIIITIDSTRPSVPVSVMSPNPVVVSVATVK